MNEKSNRAWKERYRKRMMNFLRRAHEIAAQFDGDIYVVAHKDGKYHSFTSSNRDGWPPTPEQIRKAFPPAVLKRPRDFPENRSVSSSVRGHGLPSLRRPPSMTFARDGSGEAERPIAKGPWAT